MIGPAFATTLPFDDPRGTALGSSMTPEQKADLIARIRANGADYVGQEPVQLSTAPVYVEGKLQPRPITLRVYAARTDKGWTIMPGGFARVGSSLRYHRHRHAARRPGCRRLGGQSSKPVERVSLLPRMARSWSAIPPAACPAAPPIT